MTLKKENFIKLFGLDKNPLGEFESECIKQAISTLLFGEPLSLAQMQLLIDYDLINIEDDTL